MSEVAGLLVLTSNYELEDVIDTEQETKVVTKATIQAREINRLQELGWELVGPSVVIFRKSGDGEVRGLQSNSIIADEVEVSPLAEEFEAAEPGPDPDPDES